MRAARVASSETMPSRSRTCGGTSGGPSRGGVWAGGFVARGGAAGGRLADGGELLGADELLLGALQLVELPPGLRVEACVVQRDADLVGRRLHQGHLVRVEALERRAAGPKGAGDAPA